MSVRIDGNLVDAAVGFNAVHFGVFSVIDGPVPWPERKKYGAAFGGFWI